MDTEIPVEIQCCVDEAGGLAGLKKGLPSDDTVRGMAAVGRGMADVNRVRILHLLAEMPLCVCVIKSILDLSDSKLSYHLSILAESGLVSRERESRFNIYSLTGLGRQVLEVTNPGDPHRG